MRSVLRRPVFNIEFEWAYPDGGITQHGPDSPLIPDEWKPKQEGSFTVQEIVNGPSEILTLSSEAHWFSIELTNGNNKKYQPLKDQTVLHRDFSEIPCFPVSPQAIVEFANKYGLLGIGEPVQTKTGLLMIESSSQWESEIHSMRDTVHVWDTMSGVTPLDIQDPQQLIKKTKDGFWHQSPSLRKAISADPKLEETLEEYRSAYEEWGFFGNDDYVAGLGQHDRFLENWQSRSDRRGPAKQYLINTINKHLAGNVVPQFHLERHGKGNEDILTSIAPRNLLGALWLQFFLEITRRNVRKCPMCKTPFVAQREDQLYCRTHGDGCRKRAYRARDEVLRGGKSRREVADRYHITIADLDQILAQSRKRKS